MDEFPKVATESSSSAPTAGFRTDAERRWSWHASIDLFKPLKVSLQLLYSPV
jgi:hypothetical protein